MYPSFLPNVRILLSLSVSSRRSSSPPPCSPPPFPLRSEGRPRMRREEKGVFGVVVGVIAKFGHSWDLNSPPRRHRCPQRGRTFSDGWVDGQIFASYQIRMAFLRLILGESDRSVVPPCPASWGASCGCLPPSFPSLIRPSRVEEQCISTGWQIGG